MSSGIVYESFIMQLFQILSGTFTNFFKNAKKQQKYGVQFHPSEMMKVVAQS